MTNSLQKDGDEEGGRRRGTPARRGTVAGVRWCGCARLRSVTRDARRDHGHAITDARGAGDRMAVASLSPYVTRRGLAVPFRAFAGDELLRFFTVCETAGMLG